MTRDTSHLAWVLEHMPKESNDALIKFTERNPHWRGAYWDDCLDQIMDADGHLDVTEPLWERAADTVHSARLVSAVGITLLYASRQFAEASLDQQWLMVDATIRTNGAITMPEPPQAMIKAVLDLTLIIEPMVMTHFESLVMDTEQDEALRHEMLDMLAPWAEAVQAFQAWVASR